MADKKKAAPKKSAAKAEPKTGKPAAKQDNPQRGHRARFTRKEK